MQEKTRFQIIADHVFLYGGSIGILLILASMGIHWFRDGSPFYGVITLFGNSAVDTLITVMFPLCMLTYGLFSLIGRWDEKRKEK